MTILFSFILFIGTAISPVFAAGVSDFGQGLDLASIRQKASELSVPPAVQPQTQDPSAPAALKEWTVMAFINGSNNRADLYSGSLRDLSAVGTTANVNVVVEAGFKMENRSLVQRMLLLPGDGQEINSQVYKTWFNRDMGSWIHAADFVMWAKENFPAKRYLFIIQNHGGGFVDETHVPKWPNKGISYDDVNNSYIKVPELPQLLNVAGGADIFIMNACTMQMAEVAYEIGESAGVIIASEENDSSIFYQHKERLEYLNANPQASSERIAATFVNMRRELLTPGNVFYSQVMENTVSIGSRSASTLSAIRTAELKNLPAALDAWTNAVMAANEPEAIKFAVAGTVRFGVQKPVSQPFSQFTDLGYFANRVAFASKDLEVKAATARLLEFLSRKLVFANSPMNFNSSDVDYSRTLKGLAIKMIPLTPVSPSAMSLSQETVIDTKYGDLRLSQDSQWDEFLKWAGAIFYQPR